jgi:hypothetical protein
MTRQIKRYRAIRSYAKRLGPELARRWGTHRHFTIDQVTHAAQGAGFSTDFIAYAHALFCRRSEFDAYYGPLRVACTYEGLRSVVARRYFDGVTDFDAASIIRKSKREDDGDFYESHLGEPLA